MNIGFIGKFIKMEDAVDRSGVVDAVKREY